MKRMNGRLSKNNFVNLYGLHLGFSANKNFFLKIRKNGINN